MEYLHLTWTVAIVLPAVVTIYSLETILYNLYFHPLRNCPGPALLAASRLPYLKCIFSGTLAHNHRRLHEIYGPVVRTAPNELSFSDPNAWKAIFGHEQIGQGFQKNPVFNQPALNGIHTILTEEGEKYRRNKRFLLRAFSEKALREQQHILESTTNLLIRQLTNSKESNDNGKVNLFDWYMWTLFDLIGDLAFGESFGCLNNACYSEWVVLVRNGFKGLALHNICKQLAPLDKLVMWLVPKSMKEKRKQMFTSNCHKVDHRLEHKSDRKDFLSYLMEDQHEDAMTTEELYANATLLVIAGSASTASTLTALTYFLLKNPDVREKTIKEVRTAFAAEKEITCDGVNRLTYLGAVISETMRMYPPFPEGLPRVTPAEGAYVSKVWVPPGTFVQVAAFATHRSAENFTNPDTFTPERWLGDPEFSTDKKNASQPFSVGPRSCMGKNLALLEIRLIMAKLLWSFDVTLCEESMDWEDQLSWIQWDTLPLNVRLASVLRG